MAGSMFAIAGLSSKVMFPPANPVRKILPFIRLNGALTWTETGYSKPSR